MEKYKKNLFLVKMLENPINRSNWAFFPVKVPFCRHRQSKQGGFLSISRFLECFLLP
jgi:hypothetical protein